MSTKTLLAIIFAVVCVSFSAIFVRVATAPALVIATYRMLFSFLMILPFTMYYYGKKLRNIRLRDVQLGVLSGVFLALHFITWIQSLEYTSIASSTVLVTTEPIFVVIGSYVLFREGISKMAGVGGLIAFMGSIAIGLGDLHIGGMALWGDILALLGAILVSGYILCGRGLRQRLDLLPYTFLVYGSSTIVLLLFCLLFRVPLHPYPPQDYVAFLALAFICTVLGHTIFNWALRYVQASVVSMAILGEPVGATILAALFLQEYPTPNQLVGGGIILIGLSIFTYYQSHEGRKGLNEMISAEGISD